MVVMMLILCQGRWGAHIFPETGRGQIVRARGHTTSSYQHDMNYSLYHIVVLNLISFCVSNNRFPSNSNLK